MRKLVRKGKEHFITLFCVLELSCDKNARILQKLYFVGRIENAAVQVSVVGRFELLLRDETDVYPYGEKVVFPNPLAELYYLLPLISGNAVIELKS